MKRSMRALPNHLARPVHWRWLQTHYRGIRRAQGGWRDLSSYQTMMANNVSRQREFKPVKRVAIKERKLP